MRDDVPYIQALLSAVHPALRQEEGLPAFASQALPGAGRPGDARFLHELEGGPSRQPCGFLYDRGSGLVFLGEWSQTAHAAAVLMQLHAMRSPVDWGQAGAALERHGAALADQYVEEGFGFLVQPPSQAGEPWSLVVGQDVALSPKEQLCFGDLRVCPR